MLNEEARETYIVRTAKDDYMKCSIIDNRLMLEQYNKEKEPARLIIAENVVTYCLNIDEDDCISIVYQLKSGPIYYITYPSSNREKKLELINGDEAIDYMNLKIYKKRIHVLFTVTNLKTNKSYIGHYYCEDDCWMGEERLEINNEHKGNPYYLESYCDDLFLLYESVDTMNRFIMKRYNLISSTVYDWKEVVDLNSMLNLCFFISLEGRIIIAYHTSIDNQCCTIVKHRNMSLNQKEWRKEIILFKNITPSFKPIIIQSNNLIYVLCSKNNRLIYKTSYDLIEWSEEYIIDVELVNMEAIRYITNNHKDYRFKVNDHYPYAHLLNSYSQFFNCYVHQKEEYVDFLIKQLEMKNEMYDNLIVSYSSAKNEILELKEELSQQDLALELLRSKREKMMKAYSEQGIGFEKKIKAFVEKQDEQGAKSMEIVRRLVELLNEKERIIDELLEMIKEA